MSVLITQSSSGAEPSRPGRCPVGSKLDQFAVPLPAGLIGRPAIIRASALGDPDREPIVLLGGISAHCYPVVKPCGGGGWWPGLTGKGCAIDPQQYYVIGVEFAADDLGETAPSTSDQALALAAALDVLGIKQPCTIIGASYGGMVALALAELQPERLRRLVVVSAGSAPHPAATAARELQRRVVRLGMEAGRGEDALSIARGMAMLTYRTPDEFGQRFTGGIDHNETGSRSKPGEYLLARGDSFRSVMSPGRFLSLSASIDRHRIDPSQITTPALLIGASSDQLVLPEQMTELAASLGGPAELHLLDSLYGHDMFLKEASRVGELISPFIAGAA